MRTLSELITAVAPLAIHGSRASKYADDVNELMDWFKENRGILSEGKSTLIKITDASYEFERAHGYKPTNVYIGQENWYDVKKLIHAMGCLVADRAPGRRPTIYGFNVYIVDCHEHIAVS